MMRLKKDRKNIDIMEKTPDHSERLSLLVLVAGLEPARGCPHGILSPRRLPIPPHQQIFSREADALILYFSAGHMSS